MVIREFDIICITSTGMVKKAVDGVEGDTGNASLIAMRFQFHTIGFKNTNHALKVKRNELDSFI